MYLYSVAMASSRPPTCQWKGNGQGFLPVYYGLKKAAPTSTTISDRGPAVLWQNEFVTLLEVRGEEGLTLDKMDVDVYTVFSEDTGSKHKAVVVEHTPLEILDDGIYRVVSLEEAQVLWYLGVDVYDRFTEPMLSNYWLKTYARPTCGLTLLLAVKVEGDECG